MAIARALLTNCQILLLDEATSALDAESEHLVQQAIDKAAVGRTVVVVAHRLSTIRQADQIVVMNNHRVVDVGRHDDLLSKSSKYQDLVKRQSVIMRDVSARGLEKLGIVNEVEQEEEGDDDEEERESELLGVSAEGDGDVPPTDELKTLEGEALEDPSLVIDKKALSFMKEFALQMEGKRDNNVNSE